MKELSEFRAYKATVIKTKAKDCILLLKPSVVNYLLYSMTCHHQGALSAPTLNLGLTTKVNFEKLVLKFFS